MFLWVTDFYSLEKIISAFPKILLLYLEKKKKYGEWKGGAEGFLERRGWTEWQKEGNNSKSSVFMVL